MYRVWFGVQLPNKRKIMDLKLSNSLLFLIPPSSSATLVWSHGLRAALVFLCSLSGWWWRNGTIGVQVSGKG